MKFIKRLAATLTATVIAWLIASAIIANTWQPVLTALVIALLIDLLRNIWSRPAWR